uniref:DUF7774 domain-containing protein n=1 Tax=Parascaris univalens TaxID=6257 RepID=A0A914ZWM6_PARUN
MDSPSKSESDVEMSSTGTSKSSSGRLKQKGSENSESDLEEKGANRSPLSSSNVEQVVPTSASSSSDTISQSLVEAKKDSTLFESLDEDIILDTNTLQSIATDLSQGGAAVDKSFIGEDMARQLAEIENTKETETTANAAEIKQLCEEPIIVNEVARKVVDALTSNNVLGKVLTPEEADILNSYFRRKIPLNEKVLATLDTALDKILRRAPEFYDNKEELDAFLRDPVNAKAQLLDALIAKKSSFLVDLMGDASFYANMISQGIVDVYQLATTGVLVVCGNLNAAQAAVLQGCEYSKQMASRGINLTYDAARKGTELLSSGVNTTLTAASASAEMLAKSATYAADTGISAIGQSVTMSKNAAVKGAEFTYNAATLGLSETMAVASTSATLLTKTASEATLAAVKTGQTVNEVVGQGVGYSKEIACKGAGLTYNAAAAVAGRVPPYSSVV